MDKSGFIRYLSEPMRILYVMNAKLQKKGQKHLDNSKGFLDFWEGVNL